MFTVAPCPGREFAKSISSPAVPSSEMFARRRDGLNRTSYPKRCRRNVLAPLRTRSSRYLNSSWPPSFVSMLLPMVTERSMSAPCRSTCRSNSTNERCRETRPDGRTVQPPRAAAWRMPTCGMNPVSALKSSLMR